MLYLERSIELLELPPNCQLTIQGEYQAAMELTGSEKRQAEYLLSRRCLKDCCNTFGYEFNFNPSIKNKEINLPPNLIYSISHSKQVAAAIVADTSQYQAVGIDIEITNRKLTEKFINRITTPLERTLLEKYPQDRLLLATLLFSAKESVYKAFSKRITNFSYQNIEIWEEAENLKAVILGQSEQFPTLSLFAGIYKQTHLVTCLIIPRY